MASDEQVKDLQRELQKRTDSNKALLRAQIDASTNDTRLSELVKVIGVMASKLGDYDDEFKDLADAIGDVDADKVRTGEHIKALDGVIAGDVELSEDTFEKVVGLMKEGKLEDAAKLAQSDKGVSEEDFEAAVEKRLNAVLASKFKIDGNEPVATPEKDGFDFDEWRKLPPNERVDQYDTLLKHWNG